MSLYDEFQIIERIKKTVAKPSKRVFLGIGDDAAVCERPKGKLVATNDAMVEGVHFDMKYMSAYEVGYKALAANLSDIAAMGATPRYALVSLGLKQESNEYFITELYRGIGVLAKKYGVDIIGGNIVQSPQALLVDITVIGEASKHFFTRSGAKEKDLVAVTGDLGASTAGLNCLKRLGRIALEDHRPVYLKHVLPEPRVSASLELAKLSAVTSMIDISDGFAKELHHIAEKSKKGFLIEERNIPISPHATKGAELIGSNERPWALFGGEEYELLFTFKPSQLKKVEAALKKAKTPFHVVGVVKPKTFGVQIEDSEGSVVPLEPRGWNHFVRRAPAKRPEFVEEA